jgi:1-deoxy-D-xylulose-5-phosphate synthase
MVPKDENELQHMLATALSLGSPAALRYPRGNGYGVALDQKLQIIPVGRAELLREGEAGAIFALGTMVNPALEAAASLDTEGVRLAVVNARFVKPLDETLIISLAEKFGILITIEENVRQGGFGSAVLELLEQRGLSGIRVLRLGYPDAYIPQGEQHELREMLGLDCAGITDSIRAFLASF